MHFPKHKPSIILSYKRFLNEIFKTDKNAPLKNKYGKANQNGFIKKNLRKAIMRGLRLRNTFLKEKTEKLTIHNEKNDCVNALENKKDCFVNRHINKITDKEKF